MTYKKKTTREIRKKKGNDFRETEKLFNDTREREDGRLGGERKVDELCNDL
jgi:hypothetical protein